MKIYCPKCGELKNISTGVDDRVICPDCGCEFKISIVLINDPEEDEQAWLR